MTTEPKTTPELTADFIRRVVTYTDEITYFGGNGVGGIRRGVKALAGFLDCFGKERLVHGRQTGVDFANGFRVDVHT